MTLTRTCSTWWSPTVNERIDLEETAALGIGSVAISRAHVPEVRKVIAILAIGVKVFDDLA